MHSRSTQRVVEQFRSRALYVSSIKRFGPTSPQHTNLFCIALRIICGPSTTFIHDCAWQLQIKFWQWVCHHLFVSMVLCLQTVLPTHCFSQNLLSVVNYWFDLRHGQQCGSPKFKSSVSSVLCSKGLDVPLASAAIPDGCQHGDAWLVTKGRALNVVDFLPSTQAAIWRL